VRAPERALDRIMSLDAIFGTELPLAARFIFALVIVLALIALFVLLLRRFGGSRLSKTEGRSRQPRLGVLEVGDVDGQRKLVIIRRDAVEHLVMIGGPNDVLIERNIVRAQPALPREDRPAPKEDRAAPRDDARITPSMPAMPAPPPE